MQDLLGLAEVPLLFRNLLLFPSNPGSLNADEVGLGYSEVDLDFSCGVHFPGCILWLLLIYRS